MAFKSTDLSVLAYANNFTLWHYTTADASVVTAGYFNSASDMLRIGDLVIANIAVGGSAQTKFYIVTANAGGVVTLTLYA